MNRDPFEMLADADPAKTYSPRDVDSLIAKATTRTTSPSRTLAAFKVKVLGAAALAGTLTLAAITALSGAGAPTPALLSLAAGSSAASPSAANSAMAICQWCMIAPYNFVASGLSSESSNAPVYTLTSPDPATEALTMITYLGLVSPSTSSPDPNVTEVVSGSTTIDVAKDPLGSLSISDQNGLPLPTPPSVDAASLEAATRQILDAAQVGYTLVDPVYETSTADQNNNLPGSEYVTFSVEVDGHLVNNLSVNAGFNQYGQLTDFSAPLFTVASSTTYPLISPAAGVDTLNTQAASYRAEQNITNSTDTVPEPVNTNPSTETTSGAPSATTTPDSTTTTVPQVASVTSANIIYDLTSLSDDTVAIIPVYDYSGAVAGDSTMTMSWFVPALDPTVVTVPSDWSPFQFQVWGRFMPMMYATTQGVASSAGSTSSAPVVSSSPPIPSVAIAPTPLPTTPKP